ncbi:hypothetical protein WN66_06350 [Saccharomyces cerevisiae]|nr:hypothetical protein WN66_06350 [Saccharomyces cerevisiae]
MFGYRRFIKFVFPFPATGIYFHGYTFPIGKLPSDLQLWKVFRRMIKYNGDHYLVALPILMLQPSMYVCTYVCKEVDIEKESRGERERTKKLKLFEIVLYYLSVCTPYWWNITAKFLSHFHIVPLKRNFVSIFNPLHCGGKILPLRRFL